MKYLIAIAVIALLIYMISCSLLDNTHKLLNPPKRSVEELLLPTTRTALLEDTNERMIGWSRVIVAPGRPTPGFPLSCRPKGGVNPLVIEPKTIPTVGKEMIVTWTTRACPPIPNDFAFLIGSTKPMKDPIHLGEYYGNCWLLVNPEFTLIPAEPGDPSDLLVNYNGIIVLKWTPHDLFFGTSWFLQLVVIAPGETPSGYLLSAGLELLIGN